MRHLPLRYGHVATAIVAVVSAILVSVPSATAAMAFRSGGLIAYETYTTTSVIATVNADGTGNRTLVDDAFDPAWTSDGRWLAYSSKSEIWKIRPDGTGKRRIVDVTKGQAHSPAWSPNGRRLVFTLEWEVRVGDYGESRYAIYVARRDGSRVRRLSPIYKGSGWGWPTWSPDGRMIAFRANGGKGGVAVIRPNGDRYRVLQPALNAWHLEFAPVGRRLVFVEMGDATASTLEPSQIRTLNPRTNKLRTISAEKLGTGFTWNVTWTPDGRRLAYLHQQWTPEAGSVPGSPMELLTIRANGTRIRHLMSLPGSVGGSLSWRGR